MNHWFIIEVDGKLIDLVPIEDGVQVDGAYGMMEYAFKRTPMNLHTKAHETVHELCNIMLSGLLAGENVVFVNEFVGTLVPMDSIPFKRAVEITNELANP